MKKNVFLFISIFFTSLFFHTLKSQETLLGKEILIREYGMKKPGIVNLNFLERRDSMYYKKYQFTIKLKNWKKNSCIDIVNIKCDSSYLISTVSLEDFETESEYNNSCSKQYSYYIYLKICENIFPIKLELFLQTLLSCCGGCSPFR